MVFARQNFMRYYEAQLSIKEQLKLSPRQIQNKAFNVTAAAKLPFPKQHFMGSQLHPFGGTKQEKPHSPTHTGTHLLNRIKPAQKQCLDPQNHWGHKPMACFFPFQWEFGRISLCCSRSTRTEMAQDCKFKYITK